MRLPLLAACMFLSLALTGCASIRVTEAHFLKPDAPGAIQPERYAADGITELSVVRPDGAVLNGVLLGQPGARTTILYYGGNVFHLDQHAQALLPVLAACGTNVAVFDYRGYGRSSGKPTVAHMQDDALAMFDAVDARFPGRVIVHGQSLGSFMAAHVAASRPVLATVLETTATSAAELVEAQVPWYAAPFLTIEMDPALRQVDNRAAAARFQAATLVIAAGRDKMTPPKLGKKVFEAIARPDKQLLMLEDAGHNDALRARGAQGAYCRFLQSV
ncbi:alpha/beta fold hydrolase [Massilia sp. YIM B02769]|uniref:alpha/beta hydrolase n=1 Tax=Massilia sp. YIM B02769 TaxID=3050129 RepID=UPI0025B6DE8F|nr:alpha/beta fold hydrolase [Massilia sp. YIM B02769]MDN4058457.1 alpha/beta fold hydrolase [Massilia sp. YIM B02769]